MVFLLVPQVEMRRLPDKFFQPLPQSSSLSAVLSPATATVYQASPLQSKREPSPHPPAPPQLSVQADRQATVNAGSLWLVMARAEPSVLHSGAAFPLEPLAFDIGSPGRTSVSTPIAFNASAEEVIRFNFSFSRRKCSSVSFNHAYLVSSA